MQVVAVVGSLPVLADPGWVMMFHAYHPANVTKTASTSMVMAVRR